MKILYISPRYEGGIGGHAKRIADKLRENGFEVKLLKVPHIPIKNIKNPTFALFGSIKVMLSKEKYDVVHAWNVPSAFVMKHVKAKKKVLSVHGVFSEQVEMIHSTTTSSIAKIAEEKALKLADVLTTDSKKVKESYKKKYDIDFVYLPAPLDTQKFKRIPEVTKIKNQIIYVGRDSHEKGIDLLKNIEKKIHGKVVYCTNVSWEEAMKRLKESCLLVVPSRMESLPQVIKEAFFLKKAVVATRVGGIPEIVENKVTGILVPPNNPENLLESINYLLQNPKEAEQMGEKGHDFVIKNFSWDVLLPKYMNFYKNLI